jgi:hypothetical protein
MWGGFEKRRCPLRRDKKICYTYKVKTFVNEEAEEIIFSRKWLAINEEVAYKRTINFTNVVELTNIGKCCRIKKYRNISE